jgi:hydroxymethylpyrimidine/phosphomethylpyrimidine kinase
VTRHIPNVLSIAGSDPSGGAGIQADLKTFAALGVYGCAAPTALTAQNTVEVSAVLSVPADFLRRQLEAVFADVRVDAVKIGMVGAADAVRAVAAILRAYRPSFVVLDPVLHASTGARLLHTDALDALRDELLPLATVVTPNAVEAGALLGIAAPRSIAEAREAASLLAAHGPGAALVTGGHLADAADAVDVLHDGHIAREFRVRRFPGGGTHGTGCTLSSAIAALLARGYALPEACAEGQRFVAASIARGADLRVGRGAGPVHPLGELWAHAALEIALGATSIIGQPRER